MGCAELTAVWKKNAQTAFRRINCSDDLLLDLFRTEFHVRLVWGTNGLADYPENFSERHAKFTKVLAALATICARQYWQYISKLCSASLCTLFTCVWCYPSHRGRLERPC